MLDRIAPGESDDLMLGFETSDDAAVYRMPDGQAGLFTVDFFTPIVDDPYDFGRITAANALSDVYAMGGKPLVVMNILAMPCSLGADVVGEVVRGGAEKVAEAGAVVVGGHTIDDAEPKFGLSVYGVAPADRVLRNRGAQVGDVIVLTKPIGTALHATALKRGLVTEDDIRVVIESMATLNKAAAEATEGLDVHACTDVTGFGLAGHLHEMAEASGVAARIDMAAVPLFEGSLELAQAGVVPGRTKDIVTWARDFFTWDPPLSPLDQMAWDAVVCDPQTSGGLMLALGADQAERYIARLREIDQNADPVVIGAFVAGPAGHVTATLNL